MLDLVNNILYLYVKMQDATKVVSLNDSSNLKDGVHNFHSWKDRFGGYSGNQGKLIPLCYALMNMYGTLILLTLLLNSIKNCV